MNKPRIVFAGTPEFALASLKALVEAGFDVVAVYTQPDRPAGRGRKLTSSPVKCFALEQDIKVLQPESLKSEQAQQDLVALQADLMVVAAYGILFPQNILDIPKHGCLNVHASVLPRWRGAAPIQAAILAGDKTTGVSLMQMNAGLDCGPVFAQAEITIGADENAGGLHDRLAALGGELLVQHLPSILSGRLQAREQDDSLSSYAAKIQKQQAELDWSLPAEELLRRVRAYNPVPGAYCFFSAGESEIRVKVWAAEIVPEISATPGEFIQYDDAAIVMACGAGGLKLTSLQLPGKRRASAREFAGQFDPR